MDEDIIAILIGGLIILVPVAGITARFALKPLIDSLIRMVETRRSTQEVELLERRLALVEQELAVVRNEVKELGAQSDFHRRLADPAR